MTVVYVLPSLVWWRGCWQLCGTECFVTQMHGMYNEMELVWIGIYFYHYILAAC